MRLLYWLSLRWRVSGGCVAGAQAAANNAYSCMLFIKGGVWRAPGVRTIDRSGERRLPVGDDGFARGQSRSVLVDKTMLIADVIDDGATCTLPCRPRRFGKTLNMTMLKSFFEIPTGRFSGEAMMGVFQGGDMGYGRGWVPRLSGVRFRLCALVSTR